MSGKTAAFLAALFLIVVHLGVAMGALWIVSDRPTATEVGHS